MVNTDGIAVQQLWYTSSDVGLGAVSDGFRIRAVSPELVHIDSKRVNSMDQYLRYKVPYKADPSIKPEMAPICLAYLRTDQGEDIIVHKKYVGKDSFGRRGNFFVHLLACGQHPGISFIDNTTSLWGAQFWKDSDTDLNRHSTTLQPTTLSKLNEAANEFQVDYTKVHKFLPFLITAYLMRKKDPATQIYIAAPAGSIRMIVDAIEGLIACLPLPLLKDLTFSTYERDITKTTALIVGTSWIEVSEKPVSPYVFQPQFYRGHLAINFATEERSDLHNHPLIDTSLDMSLAEDFAERATQRLLSGYTKDLDTLREEVDHDSKLTIEHFLSIFRHNLIGIDDISSSQIEYYLKDQKYCISKLSDPDFRQKIIDYALKDERWRKMQLVPQLHILRQQSQHESATPVGGQSFDREARLSQGRSVNLPQSTWRRRHDFRPASKPISLMVALSLLADSAIKRIIGNYAKPVTPQRSEELIILLQIISSCMLPAKLVGAVRALLKQFRANSDAYQGLINDWPSLFQVLHLGMALSDEPVDVEETISPFLKVVAWPHLGEFLGLDLYQRHWQWVVVVVGKLARDSSLNGGDVQLLRQPQYSSALDKLLQELLKRPDQWLTTADFTIRLTEKGYKDSSYMQRQAVLLDALIADTKLNSWVAAKNIIVALVKAGHINQAQYPAHVQQLVEVLLSNKEENMAIELCRELVSHGYQRKADLLPLLLDWSTRYRGLKDALALIYRTLPERDSFFLQHGELYLASSMYVQDMVNLYRELRDYSRNMLRLPIMLNSTLSEEEKVGLLRTGGPEKLDEYVEFLEHDGKSYLQGYRQFPRLASVVIECYGELVKYEYAEKKKLCDKLFQGAVADQHREDLLTLASPFSIDEYIGFFKKYGQDERYIPFCCQSPIVLNWFSSLVQLEQAQPGAFPEKMTFVLSWLKSAVTGGQTLAQKTLVAVANILSKACLTPQEEKDFLEHLGREYLPYFAYLLLLKGFVERYIDAFAASDLERQDAVSFLTYLHEQSSSLGLESHRFRRLGAWQTVYEYVNKPRPYLSKLLLLANAVCELNLEYDATFVTKLAQKFVGWIRFDSDLLMIMRNFACIKRKEQLFYNIAEQGAETHQDKVARLKIYIIFILSYEQEITKTNNQYFIKGFIDTLLTYVRVNALSTWRQLDSYVRSQDLRPQAMEQWRVYLTNLGLTERVLAQQEHEVAQMVANQRQPLSLGAAFIPEQIREVDSYVSKALSEQDFQEIIQRLKYMNKKEQFFYKIAEERAKSYRSNADVLYRYVIFICSFAKETGVTDQYMIQNFLDTLLPPIRGLDDPLWMTLDGSVKKWPSPGVVKQWEAYVQPLNLFSSGQGGVGLRPRVQSRLLPP